MKIIAHNDLDGRASAFWVYYAYRREAELIEVDYNKSVPIYSVEPNEKVFIVDFSIKPNEMTDLLGITPDVVWIDHHISSIQEYDNFLPKIKGVREVGKAACLLTFEYLYPGKEPPEFTKLISDFDLWKFEYGDRTRHFAYGLQSVNNKPDSPIWAKLTNKDYVEQLISEGKSIKRYREHWTSDLRSKLGFETIFEDYRCFALNLGSSSADAFGDLEDAYDIVISFSYNGKEFIITMYSNSIDVSKIAKKYGGGGHVGAAGFSAKTLPFVTKPIVQQIDKINEISKKTFQANKKLEDEVKVLKRRFDDLEQRVLINDQLNKQFRKRNKGDDFEEPIKK